MGEFLQRVQTAVEKRRLFLHGQKILVAVSGGADSMVLLHVLNGLAKKQRWKIFVAHFNHRLRGRASDADEKLVEQTATKLRLKFFRGGADVKAFAAQSKISVEMAARKLRHEFLARTAREQKISTTALAHHADDQVELFFLRLLRGAGGEGMAGMKWRSPSPAGNKIALVRPLLGFAKAEILEFANANKISFRDDATNFSGDFLRNRIRNELLPLLQKNYQPGLSKTVLRLMEITGAEAEFASEAARQWLGSAPAPGAAGRASRPAKVRAKVRTDLKDFGASRFFAGARKTAPGAGALPNFDQLSDAVQRKALQQQLMELGVVADFELVEQLRAAPGKGVSINASSSVARDPVGKISLINSGRPAAAEFNDDEFRLELSGKAGRADFGGWKFNWKLTGATVGRSEPDWPSPHQPGAEFFDADQIGGEIILRHWRAGDRFQPIGLKSAVKLQDLFVNAKIPAAQRRNLILAATAAGEIFWVEGLRIGEKFKLTSATKRRLRWNWSKTPA